MNIVINGIGVAGPALAYWLTKSGHEVLLVEEAPQLRVGGYIIDFWGIGYEKRELRPWAAWTHGKRVFPPLHPRNNRGSDDA